MIAVCTYVQLHILLFYIISEYATVGYMAKRIQMRKNRFLAIQKIAEQKKLGVDGGPDSDHAPKQTVSSRPVGGPHPPVLNRLCLTDTC